MRKQWFSLSLTEKLNLTGTLKVTTATPTLAAPKQLLGIHQTMQTIKSQRASNVFGLV